MDESQKTTAVEAFREAVAKAKSQSALARICGCTPGNISQLILKGSLLPGQYVLKVEERLGISRHRLRPDLYPHPSTPGGPAADGGHTLPAGRTIAGGAPASSRNRSPNLQPEPVR